jgi:hypothetical protein
MILFVKYWYVLSLNHFLPIIILLSRLLFTLFVFHSYLLTIKRTIGDTEKVKLNRN